ncbi:aminotransferase class V-fold PLP-dependent enzyme [Maritalea sp.]|uniref:aminotransferase class V-fold PLP-dependent enzyme n=1 Tax=Maritalea sp. TaxID=2003361 RepID=UPI003EF93E9B
MEDRSATKDDGYFLYHSIGQYPQKGRDLAEATSTFAQVWSAVNDQQWDYLLGQRAEFIRLWSALIGAASGSVTSCENVTQGMHMLITSLPDNMLRGCKVLVGADCFPSNHFLLTGLQQKLGFELETVAMRQGASWVDDDDFIAHWDKDVALALVTWVSSTTSHKADLERLAQHGRDMGSLVGVDITQAAGLLPFSVDAPRVDFAISTSLKWMCGTPGAGMLYVRPELIVECTPEVRGWFSQDNPFNWALDTFEFANDIRRFDNGTPSILSAAATVPALKWHAALDKVELLKHNRSLSQKILDAIKDTGLKLVSPSDAKNRGGSVMVQFQTVERVQSFLTTMREADLYADCRGATLRLSPGVMTSVAATDQLAALLAETT